MKKTKRIAWGITGSGHYLKESMQIIDEFYYIYNLKVPYRHLDNL